MRSLIRRFEAAISSGDDGDGPGSDLPGWYHWLCRRWGRLQDLSGYTGWKHRQWERQLREGTFPLPPRPTPPRQD